VKRGVFQWQHQETPSSVLPAPFTDGVLIGFKAGSVVVGARLVLRAVCEESTLDVVEIPMDDVSDAAGVVSAASYKMGQSPSMMTCTTTIIRTDVRGAAIVHIGLYLIDPARWGREGIVGGHGNTEANGKLIRPCSLNSRAA
jgi:hypothetical protein